MAPAKRIPPEISLDKSVLLPYGYAVRGSTCAQCFLTGALLLMKTYQPKAGEIDRRWILVDAQGQTLGRLATRIAGLLRGKGKPVFAPHLDVGDFVVVVNAEKVTVTGRKPGQKVYYHHSQYPGGLKSTTLEKLLREKPERVLEKAVRGMLPKNRLGDALFGKLKVYAGPVHPHAAQRPAPLAVASQ
jgi:large subunit ribosomal protein L13